MARTSSAPPPPPTDPAADSTASGTPTPAGTPNRFFAWLRSLGLDRQPGWVGGVSAGIAARLGIDPLIVRGGFVVVALLGGPALVIYAAAWLVLPDSQDKIHLEQVLRGRFESAMAGIAALIALSMLPLTQGFWYAGSTFWGDPVLPDSIGRALWTFIVLGLLAWAVVWMVRRSSTTQAQRAAAPDAAATAAPAASAPATPLPAPTAQAPTAPAAGAPEEDFAAWREQQTAWKNQYDAYRHHNAEASLRAQELHRQRRLATSAANAERMQAWHRANPRLRASLVFIILGAAIVIGGISSQLAPAGQAWVVGLGVGTLVVGIGTVIAAVCRRRNGFLTFVGILLLPATLVAAFLPADRELLSPTSISITTTESSRVTQLAGHLYVDVPAPDPKDPGEPVTLDVWQGAGSMSIDLAPGASVRVIASQRGGRVNHTVYSPYTETPEVKNDYSGDGVVDSNDDYNGDGTVNSKDGLSYSAENSPIPPTATRAGGEDYWDKTFGEGTPTTIIRVWQGYGSLDIQDAVPGAE